MYIILTYNISKKNSRISRSKDSKTSYVRNSVFFFLPPCLIRITLKSYTHIDFFEVITCSRGKVGHCLLWGVGILL